ncbi:Uncharacterised protein [Mycobacteroides abscessus subsp. abscessus]|nr:Uncharacterised protein [Mycobacteroides abscessus subsp. abscessus]
MHVIVGGLSRHFLRRLEQRTHIDVVTFCPRSCPSCPILATSTRGRRPSASANFCTSSVARVTLLTAPSLPTSSRYTPLMVRISA